MKCENCGADLCIDHQRCPYCGTANPYYKKHREDMNRYQQEFQETKQDVYRVTNRYTGLSVRITIVAVLVALNALAFFGREVLADQISYEMQCSRDVRQADAFHTELERMEQEGDYIGITQFCNSHNVWRVDALDDFSQIRIVCGNYEYIYYAVMKLVYYSKHDPERDIEYQLDLIDSSLKEIYQAMDRQDSYGDDSAYSGSHKEGMEKCLEQIYALLYTYCNVSREDLQKFPELTSVQRRMILEEGVQLNEAGQ